MLTRSSAVYSDPPIGLGRTGMELGEAAITGAGARGGGSTGGTGMANGEAAAGPGTGPPPGSWATELGSMFGPRERATATNPPRIPEIRQYKAVRFKALLHLFRCPQYVDSMTYFTKVCRLRGDQTDE